MPLSKNMMHTTTALTNMMKQIMNRMVAVTLISIYSKWQNDGEGGGVIADYLT